MANPPKQKGTGGETELRQRLEEMGVIVHRTSAGSTYDLDRGNKPDGHKVLATRPDRGRWLVTITAEDWASLVNTADQFYDIADLPIHIEVKRYKRFALHSLYEEKFSR